MEVPAAVREAAARAVLDLAAFKVALADLDACPVTRGDLWLARGDGGTQVVLVKQVLAAHILFHSCHDTLEAATSLDLVVRDGPLVPFAFVVAGELYGTVLAEQLVRRVGRLDRARTAAAVRALWTDGASLDGFECGSPLRGPLDWRWGFYQGDVFEVHTAICGPSRRLLLGEVEPFDRPDSAGGLAVPVHRS